MTGRSSLALVNAYCCATIVLSVPGRPMMMLIPLPGRPPPRTSSSGWCPLRSLVSVIAESLPDQERAGAEQVPDSGDELQWVERLEQEGVRACFQSGIARLDGRYRDDGHPRLLFEGAAEGQAHAARDQ